MRNGMAKSSLPYHRENLEETLLLKAAEIVAAEGIEALSLRELGRRAKVSRTAPYHYFPNKAALMAGIVQLGFRRLRDRIQSAIENVEAPEVRVRTGFRAYVAFAIEAEQLFRPMFASVLPRGLLAKPGPGLPAFAFSSEEARAAFALMTQGIVDMLRARKGDRRDPLLLTNVLWSFAHGVAVLTVDGNLKHGNVDAVLDAGLDALIGVQKSR
jgi:AcrR family transcriptional regulator